MQNGHEENNIIMPPKSFKTVWDKNQNTEIPSKSQEQNNIIMPPKSFKTVWHRNQNTEIPSKSCKMDRNKIIS